jgi:hypothetical protein
MLGAPIELEGPERVVGSAHAAMLEAMLAGEGLARVAEIATGLVGAPVDVLIPRPGTDGATGSPAERYVAALVTGGDPERPADVTEVVPIASAGEVQGAVVMRGEVDQVLEQDRQPHCGPQGFSFGAQFVGLLRFLQRLRVELGDRVQPRPRLVQCVDPVDVGLGQLDRGQFALSIISTASRPSRCSRSSSGAAFAEERLRARKPRRRARQASRRRGAGRANELTERLRSVWGLSPPEGVFPSGLGGSTAR